MPHPSGIYNVMDAEFGAKGDGSVDDGPSIGRAIKKAIEVRGEALGQPITGGIVYCPPGIYWIHTPLKIQEGVTLSGAGWDATKFIITKDKESFNPIDAMAGGVIRDIDFYHFYAEKDLPNEGVPWTPKRYGYAIVGSKNVQIRNVRMVNPRWGVKVSGRFLIEHFYAHPIEYPLVIENTDPKTGNDCSRVDHVHLWQWWQTEGNELYRYAINNAVGVLCVGADNPLLSNIFARACDTGIQFGRNKPEDRKTSRFHLLNADFDGCCNGIVIFTAGTEGQICNLTASGGDGEDGNVPKIGFVVDAPFVSVQCTNVEFGHYGTNCVDVKGKNTRVYFHNLICKEWSLVKPKQAAVAATNGATVEISKAGCLIEGGVRDVGQVLFK